MEGAHYKLLIGDLTGCKAAIDECEKILDEISGIDTVINATYYRVAADYYKVKFLSFLFFFRKEEGRDEWVST